MRDVPVPVRPGDVIDGKYRVEAVLGKGGMGAVVRARHEALGRSVAIKLLLPDMMQSSGMVQRFEREARAAARLKNDHVIDVIDVGRLPSGEPFIVMELLDGTDLAKHLEQRRRLSVEETIEIILQVCDAVGEAHAAGIVHRDLKPHNIFLTARRDRRVHVKVLDFGISKVHGDVDGGLTGSQEMLGSPYYMSPEQLLSTRDVGPSADIWAIGVILYQLLTGRVPFAGETLAAITTGICSYPHAPIATVRSDLPPWLTSLIEQCLRKDPIGRIRSVDALSEALRSRGQSATMPAYTPNEGVQRAPSMPDAMVTAASTNAVVSPSPRSPAIVHAPTIVQPAPTLMPGASTNVGWGTSTSPRKSGGGAALVVVGGLLVALLFGGGYALRRLTRQAPASAPSAAAEPVTVAPPPVVSTPAAPVAAPDPPASTPPQVPSAVTSTTKPVKTNRPTSKPTATGDDLPSLRK
jgi:eukaryotic-like serine/threonine-protein kinase